MNPIRALRALTRNIETIRSRIQATEDELLQTNNLINNLPTSSEATAIREEIHAIRSEISSYIQNISALSTENISLHRLAKCRNEFARLNACKHFSQTDEDGITLAILNRIGIPSDPTFIELGVGDGLENNSLVLLASGWRGCWLGGQELAFNVPPRTRLSFVKAWIDLNNFSDLFIGCLRHLNVDIPNLVSIDLDGNDFYYCKEILTDGIYPDIFICEYNAVFPPHAKWIMPYDEKHEWSGDHLFSASLASFNDLFNKHDYFLCACNPQTGANAFFVRNKYRELFPDVPVEITDIYVSPFYQLGNQFTHKITGELIESILMSNPMQADEVAQII
jgi:hypothetical protein